MRRREIERSREEYQTAGSRSTTANFAFLSFIPSFSIGHGRLKTIRILANTMHRECIHLRKADTKAADNNTDISLIFL